MNNFREETYLVMFIKTDMTNDTRIKQIGEKESNNIEAITCHRAFDSGGVSPESADVGGVALKPPNCLDRRKHPDEIH